MSPHSACVELYARVVRLQPLGGGIWFPHNFTTNNDTQPFELVSKRIYTEIFESAEKKALSVSNFSEKIQKGKIYGFYCNRPTISTASIIFTFTPRSQLAPYKVLYLAYLDFVVANLLLELWLHEVSKNYDIFVRQWTSNMTDS